ncbi:MAG: hypothetical protein F6K32_14030 [Desertifilum sp. SIO1I2]|nr:hypothetical protein [Desertifilum sp. SIO1I2]
MLGARKTIDSIPSPEQLTTAIQTIDQLSGWLENSGLNQAAIPHSGSLTRIAQWKFNALAAMYPELQEVTELAKQLIGSSSPLTEVGMTVTEVASALTESLELKIKPEQVNQALVALGYQQRNDQKRIWILTEAGKEYGTSLLATSGSSKWQGPQVKWHRSVLPILEEYFRETSNPAVASDTDKALLPQDELSNSNGSLSKSTTSTESNSKSKKAWTVAERIKELNLKSNPMQIQLIQDFADESYLKQYGTKPPKLSGRRASTSSYPASSVDLVDRAIDTVFNPKKKSN